MKILIALAALLALSAPTFAATPPAPPRDAITTIKQALRSSLKDPFSLKQLEISMGDVADGSWPFNKGQWFYCTKFYAKNSLGGYDHFIQLYFFRGDKVVDTSGGPISNMKNPDPCDAYIDVSWKP